MDPITTSTVNTSEIIGQSLTVVQSDIMNVIGQVAPIAFGIMAAILAIRFGLSFVRSVVGRGR
jgi:hypothetical protein